MTHYGRRRLQMSLAGVTGLDIPGLLTIAEAVGYPREGIAQLLPYAEEAVLQQIAEAEKDKPPEKP